MKNLTARVTRIISAFLLIFSMLFATAFINTPNSYVYADEDDEPGNNIQVDEGDDNPGNNIQTDDEDNTPGNNIQVDENDDTNPGNNIQVNEGDENPGNNIQVDGETGDEEGEQPNTCQDQVGALAWIVCPTTGVIAKAIDAIYGIVDGLSIVPPLSMEASSPIYLIWQYARNITNIVFVIFLLIVIYSQLTGLGLNNYGVKRILPRLIIAVILVNLSFVICSIAVDLSNIIGSSLRDFFAGIQETVIANGAVSEVANVPIGDIVTTILAGTGIAGIAIGATGGGAALFWMLVPVLVGGLISVVSGLLTIAARQALVALLVMISPLAFVAYLLPNTEKWFERWKDLLFKMLIFYPMFSFLFGASQLAGWALITSAHDGFGIILGIAVQIFPLIFSWSLMKMSGTVLSAFNAGLRKLAAPAERGLAGWSLSHKELNRQRYLANSSMPGAKLRRYLDYRRELRELDTKNSIEIRHGKAHERALITASSSTGVDENGNDTWSKHANRYTQNAKRAALYGTRVGVADAAYRNTLSAYGRHFSGSGAARLSDAHGEAYLDSMKQQFLAANEAQADQDYLLDRYLQASIKSETNPYQFNRLVRGAAGSLGHTGEASIMGQVIVGNANIERRRRTEAGIIIAKFGVNKADARGMFLDIDKVNDNGREIDADGEEIEDEMWHIKPGKQHTPWQHYIGVHKKSGVEITKEEYDALDPEDRDANYRKVRYFDIRNDQKQLVQRVYEDDAGYMKELLVNNINIADPINDRYAWAIGIGDKPGEETGILRRYHSTISAAMLGANYKEKDAAYTSMLAAHMDGGGIATPGELNIAKWQSFNASAKPNMFPINDVWAIKRYMNQLNTMNFSPEEIFHPDGTYQDPNNYLKDFAFWFPGADIDNYTNVNQEALKGLRPVFDDEGRFQKWESVSFNESTLEEKQNYIKHTIFTRGAKKLVGVLNRNLSPNVMDNQKPDTLEALINLAAVLEELGQRNIDPNVPYDQKLDPNVDIYASNDPGITKRLVEAAKQRLADYRAGLATPPSDEDALDIDWGDDDDYDDDGPDDLPPSAPRGPQGPRPPRGNNGSGQSADAEQIRASIRALKQKLRRLERRQNAQNQINDLNTLLDTLKSHAGASQNMTEFAKRLNGLTEEASTLQDPILAPQIQEIIQRYSQPPRSTSTEGSIDEIVNARQHDRDAVRAAASEINTLLGGTSLFDLPDDDIFLP